MRSSSDPWESLDALLEGGGLPSPGSRVFKRVRLAGVCRVPAPLGEQAGTRLENGYPLEVTAILDAERERAREEGARRGYEEGFREGWEEARREAAELVRAAAALRDGLERARRELLAGLEREVAEMALEVGEKLALQKLDGNADSLGEMVRAVISRAADRRSLRVRMHPRDLRLLADRVREIASSFTDVEGMELVEDAEILPGGCVVETPAGTIDGRLEERLERVRGAVLPEEGVEVTGPGTPRSGDGAHG
ncbi:MAG: FliH/SctL family protein [Actinomycetota bacterium]|nr:FliH/SctL family protein [Actinomycetota bacterium]MDI7252736.1 FliH/SctL family protein [Actinomycetota bacterium]